MSDHGFGSVGDFIGASLPYFTTHADLVNRLLGKRQQVVTASRDDDWAATTRLADLADHLTTGENVLLP